MSTPFKACRQAACKGSKRRYRGGSAPKKASLCRLARTIECTPTYFIPHVCQSQHTLPLCYALTLKPHTYTLTLLDDDYPMVLMAAGSTEPSVQETRTKVRRLYDIANVLASLDLLERSVAPDSLKPAYRWLRAPDPALPADDALLAAAPLLARCVSE